MPGRSSRFPRLTKLRTCFGPLITLEQIESMTDEQLIDEVHRRILACHREARRFRGLEVSDEAAGDACSSASTAGQ